VSIRHARVRVEGDRRRFTSTPPERYAALRKEDARWR
jgi:hypothetical protein